jgi:hypothetical protein
VKDLTEGRMVHFVLPDGHNVGDHRPAIVVKVCRNGSEDLPVDGYSNLQVFTDSVDDGTQYAGGLVWRKSVPYDEAKKPGTWHWIEEA